MLLFSSKGSHANQKLPDEIRQSRFNSYWLETRVDVFSWDDDRTWLFQTIVRPAFSGPIHTIPASSHIGLLPISGRPSIFTIQDVSLLRSEITPLWKLYVSDYFRYQITFWLVWMHESKTSWLSKLSLSSQLCCRASIKSCHEKFLYTKGLVTWMKRSGVVRRTPKTESDIVWTCKI